MKSQILKYASVMLAAAMLLAAADTASASNKKNSKNNHNNRYDSRDRDRDCDRDRDRDDRDCDRRDRDRDCDDDDDNGGPVSGSATVGINPVGSVVVTTESEILIQVPYTAPAGSGAVITLLQDGAPVGTFTVPSNSTSGTAVFNINIVGVTATVFQARLAYTTGSSGGDDDDDDDCRDRRSSHYSSKSKKGKSYGGCNNGGSGGGSGSVVTIFSDTLNVVREDGGPVGG